MSQTPNYIDAPKLKGKYQKPITNLIGKQFGILTVVEIQRNEDHIRWICRCECGVEKAILGTHLTRGLINSCGCKRAEYISKAKQTDLIGHQYGRWTVTSGPIKHKTASGAQILWDCLCSCGTVGTIYAGHLVGGKSRSCGCLCIEATKKSNTTHGATTLSGRLPEYHVWAGMHARCKRHPRYVGKGIRVCARWCNFPAFLEDMGSRPSPELSIDRIKNSLHYSCGRCAECSSEGWEANCRWGTDEVQANNKDNNILLELHGVTKTAAQWSRELGIHVGTIYSRAKKGWSDKRVLTEPLRTWPSRCNSHVPKEDPREQGFLDLR